MIEKAFKGVKRLHEKNVLLGAAALDDGCYSEELMADLHKREERKDWRQISPGMLLACDDSLCYLGAEGFRFLMPVYMVLALKYRIPERISFWFPSMGGVDVKCDAARRERASRRFELFSPKQRQAVQRWFSSQRRWVHEDSPYSPKEVPFLPWEYVDYHENCNGISPLEYLGLSS